jgi:thiol-disulfide isomerase/thioredoxin
MRSLIFLSLLAVLTACSPGGSPIDTSNDDDSTNAVDPEPVSPYHPDINWDECRGREGEHPCNIISFDQNGDEFDLYKYYGSLIVLDLSTMWCGPCNQAGAHAQEVQDQYIDEDLVYITVLIEDQQGGPVDLSDLQQWATAYGNTTSPVVSGDRSLLTSGGGTFDLTSWPTFFYIDRDMLIRDVDKGYNGTEVIYSIEWLLTL